MAPIVSCPINAIGQTSLQFNLSSDVSLVEVSSLLLYHFREKKPHTHTHPHRRERVLEICEPLRGKVLGGNVEGREEFK